MTSKCFLLSILLAVTSSVNATPKNSVRVDEEAGEGLSVFPAMLSIIDEPGDDSFGPTPEVVGGTTITPGEYPYFGA
jgi:hypothetical protein